MEKRKIRASILRITKYSVLVKISNHIQIVEKIKKGLTRFTENDEFLCSSSTRCFNRLTAGINKLPGSVRTPLF